MNISIKNTVCNRCIMVVRQQFEKPGLPPVHVELGSVKTAGYLSEVRFIFYFKP